MESFKIDISNIGQHSNAAQLLLKFAKDQHIFLFDAQMGAGKTTFIKSLSLSLGVTDTMSSPTYSIVNEYHTGFDYKIFHFDLYRLKSSEELFEIGFEEYLSSNHYVFIEWPELAEPFLDSFVRIIITVENNNRYLRAQIIKNH